jgi:hypothetical protein
MHSYRLSSSQRHRAIQNVLAKGKRKEKNPRNKQTAVAFAEVPSKVGNANGNGKGESSSK